ncbi:hypothetical protein A2W24_05610 [Microgenomates group bacterium RBG_16_45_19]|nr:MAG: hypothetical protein A2W24_05610 [Microgenomates group bacterium RBG_16_45_19]
MELKSINKNSWQPDRPTSKGATAYHEAVVKASWHQENINGMIELLKSSFNEGQVLIDFGAGTGASAIYLLKVLPKTATLWLMDNSASWLGKAYEILHQDQRVRFALLPKKGNGFTTPDEVIGTEATDYVISANTVHLIKDLKQTFTGIYRVLKRTGSFTFQSGNITRAGRKPGVLMIDDTINQVHDLAIDLIKTDRPYQKYRHDLKSRIKQETKQRRLIFPKPRSIELYKAKLKAAGFKKIRVTYKLIPIKYIDWLKFLRVRRLQAGILPEVGSREATLKAELDRDRLITRAAKLWFNQLKQQNRLYRSSFMAEWIYVTAQK